MPKDTKQPLRIFPENWLYPSNLQQFFNSPQPLHIDLGSGKGRFILATAQKRPEINILGIERQLVRVRKVGKHAVRRHLDNIRLLRIEGQYAVNHLIPDESVNSYYVFFPDPWPKKKHAFHRLFNPVFLDGLYRTLENKGVVHFATDHLPYFYSVSNILSQDKRFSEIPHFEPSPDELTDFELLFRDNKAIARMSVTKIK